MPSQLNLFGEVQDPPFTPKVREIARAPEEPYVPDEFEVAAVELVEAMGEVACPHCGEKSITSDEGILEDCYYCLECDGAVELEWLLGKVPKDLVDRVKNLQEVVNG